jgi:hypothetical protein
MKQNFPGISVVPENDSIYNTFPSFSTTALSTAWMPLEGLAEQWGQFGAEATSAPALHATGMVFSALARETEAQERHMEAWHTSREPGVTDLEHTLEELTQARQHWTDALRFLEMFILDEQCADAFRDAMHSLVTEAMGQRLRVSTLIREVEQEQLLACHSVAHPSEREEVRR